MFRPDHFGYFIAFYLPLIPQFVLCMAVVWLLCLSDKWYLVMAFYNQQQIKSVGYIAKKKPLMMKIPINQGIRVIYSD